MLIIRVNLKNSMAHHIVKCKQLKQNKIMSLHTIEIVLFLSYEAAPNSFADLIIDRKFESSLCLYVSKRF